MISFINTAQFFKNNKTIIYIVLIVLGITSIIFGVKSCNNNKSISNNLKIANDSLNMKIVEFKDDSSNIHARVLQLQLSNGELKSLNINLQKHYNDKIDSLSKILKVKPKSIQQYISIAAKSTGAGIGKIDTIKPNRDSTNSTEYDISSNDGYLNYTGKLTNKKFSYKYNYDIKLIATNFYKRKGFLNLRKEYYWDISSPNPNTTIIGLEQFSTQSAAKYKRFSVVVGPSVGLGSDFKIRIQPISITLGIKIIEF